MLWLIRNQLIYLDRDINDVLSEKHKSLSRGA